ncbi:DUF4272 domain-containing protein [Deinococcus sp.]|uniref:DUF4272 domain-containing protein n=1 Tax=Deinococcus sp. TaxID=47478 RepID=UPI003C7CA9D9
MLVNAYCTLRQPPPPDFPHTLIGRRDRSHPDLATHLDGFVGYVLNTRSGEMTATLYHVTRHLQRVQTQFSLEVEASELGVAFIWARRANALCFWPDGTVRDPAGRALVYPDGSPPDVGAEIPYPADALERKARSEAQLARLEVRVPASLPPVLGEGEATWRNQAEAEGRAQALMAVALIAETRGEGDPLPVNRLAERLPAYATFLSPQERAFLAEDASPPEQVAKFSWRYEALGLLQWALGLSADLPVPGAICDVPAVARTAFEQAAARRPGRLRPAPELLDALDLTFRLHWAVRDAGLKGRDAPAGLLPGVVFERHHALNWLSRFEDHDWDEVDTPT